jgi:hypothetical protein
VCLCVCVCRPLPLAEYQQIRVFLYQPPGPFLWFLSAAQRRYLISSLQSRSVDFSQTLYLFGFRRPISATQGYPSQDACDRPVYQDFIQENLPVGPLPPPYSP